MNCCLAGQPVCLASGYSSVSPVSAPFWHAAGAGCFSLLVTPVLGCCTGRLLQRAFLCQDAIKAHSYSEHRKDMGYNRRNRPC